MKQSLASWTAVTGKRAVPAATGKQAVAGRRTVAWRRAVAHWCAGIAAVMMVITAGFHLLWMVDPWPLANWSDFDRTIMGDASAGAGHGASWVVGCVIIAGLLLAAAYIVGTRAGLFWRLGPWWAFRVAAWVIVGVFLGRAVMGVVTDVPEELPAHHWNLVLYSPLCLFLGVASAAAILCAGVHPRGRDGASASRRP